MFVFLFFFPKKKAKRNSARISYSLLYYYTCIILYDIFVMGGVTFLSWGDIYFMLVLWIIKPHFKKSISNFFPKIGSRARTKKPPNFRRHKQKVKKLKIQTLFRMDLLKWV